jgi:hypothetical protein
MGLIAASANVCRWNANKAGHQVTWNGHLLLSILRQSKSMVLSVWVRNLSWDVSMKDLTLMPVSHACLQMECEQSRTSSHVEWTFVAIYFTSIEINGVVGLGQEFELGCDDERPDPHAVDPHAALTLMPHSHAAALAAGVWGAFLVEREEGKR